MILSMSDVASVDFPVRMIDSSKFIWRNNYEFDDNDWHNILCDFGVTSIESHGCMEYTGEYLKADLYGNSNGSPHGGSGRCGFKGDFNAKGIGVTPLVSPNVDWGHSHGRLFLYDALREVVGSQILNAETPHGAVPILAVIDANISIPPVPGDAPERCGINVRPNFVRAAHFERSVFFGTSGFDKSDQHQDSLRVKEMVRYADDYLVSPGGAHPGFDLGAMFMAFADQTAVTRAHRIWAGLPLTDNLTVKGQFLDYGCFRSLPNWKSASDNDRQFFGKDMVNFRESARSLVHFFQKYSAHGPSVRNPAVLVNAVQERLTTTFKNVCATSCGFEPGSSSGRAISDLLLEYYCHQQQKIYYLSERSSRWQRKEWLFHDLPSLPADPQSAGSSVARELASLLLDSGEDDRLPGPARWAAARRWLSPRPLQYYHVSKARARRVVRQLEQPGADASRIVSDFIGKEVALSRRMWSRVESNHVILGYATDITSSALFTYDVYARAHLAILNGPVVDGDVTLFGQKLRLGDKVGVDGDQVEVRLPVSSGGLRLTREVRLWDQALWLPAAQLVFDDALVAASLLEERQRHG